MRSRIQEIDELYMLECLTLAANGAGAVSPNPQVGAVLTKDGRVIGRGYHKAYGAAHAEVNAVRSAKALVQGATLYVNVEPCAHFGKTPPCADLIIGSNVRRVVVGMRDPNPLVSGKGIRKLQRAGITVREGVLRSECEKLNESFTKYVTTKLPFVALKIAQTLDGTIADTPHHRTWITNGESRVIVHRLRSSYDAVLVGAGTILSDDPLLTVRDVRGRNPVRVVLDGRLRSDPGAKVFASAHSTRTILFTCAKFSGMRPAAKKALITKGVEIIECPGDRTGTIPVRTVMASLAKIGIASVLVEGGASVFSQFLKSKVTDKAYLFIAPAFAGRGLHVLNQVRMRMPIRMSHVTSWNVGGDTFIEGYLNK